MHRLCRGRRRRRIRKIVAGKPQKRESLPGRIRSKDGAIRVDRKVGKTRRSRQAVTSETLFLDALMVQVSENLVSFEIARLRSSHRSLTARAPGCARELLAKVRSLAITVCVLWVGPLITMEFTLFATPKSQSSPVQHGIGLVLVFRWQMD